jgi:large subunit ribosomal protein L21
MYAVIEVGGRQHKVSPGDVVYTESLKTEEGSRIEFAPLFWHNGSEFMPGTPDVKVKADVVKNGKSKKMSILTYKAKKGSKRKIGHRQNYTKLEIISID